jgi:hypothetical protein
VEYVYFVASLPAVSLTGAPPFTSPELLAAAAGVLRDDHWHDLRALLEDRRGDVRSPEARELVAAEARLRSALARLRAQRAGADAGQAARLLAIPDARAADVAARAMALEDPLERERLLDRHRWQLLDAAAAFPAFGVQAVFAYALKLRLAEKWSAMDEEAGLAVAHGIVEDDVARYRQ